MKHTIKRNTKGTKPAVRKTARRELTPLQRAIAVNQAQNGVSHRSIAAEFTRLGHPIGHSAISTLVLRTEERVRETGLTFLHDEIYQTSATRGTREPVLSEAWKDVLEEAVTRDKESRLVQARNVEAILPGEFPKVSTSTIEAALYERGYRRIKGAWKSNGVGKGEHDAQPRSSAQPATDSSEFALMNDGSQSFPPLLEVDENPTQQLGFEDDPAEQLEVLEDSAEQSTGVDLLPSR